MVGKILKSMHIILNDTPARRKTFKKITETNVYPPPYCGRRWCKNEDCLDRADVIWLSLTKFIKYLKLLPKSKQTAGKSYPILVKAIEDKLLQAKMKLVEYISSKLNEFLRGFQIDQPMVPFLCQSAVERGFAINDGFVVENPSEVSLIALRMVHDHLRAKGVASHNIEISTNLRKSVPKARERDKEHLKEQREKIQVTEKDLKRKIVGEEIKEVQQNKCFLDYSIEGLQKDADKYATDALKKKDFTLLQRSNDFRDLITTKQKKIAELDEMEQTLNVRKDSIIYNCPDFSLFYVLLPGVHFYSKLSLVQCTM